MIILSSTIRQLFNEIILPKNVDIRPSIGAIIIYNRITLPIFCSIQNLMFYGSSKDTNIGVILNVLSNYKLKTYSEIIFKENAILPINRTDNKGVKLSSSNSRVTESLKLFYKDIEEK
jgi:hypothetical protein